MKVKNRIILLALCAIPLLNAGAKGDTTPDLSRHETPAQYKKRMHWWEQARFGMFIHWGLYSQLAGYWKGKETPGLGEWIMHDDRIPVDQYAAMAKDFDPVQFNADRIVKLAKDAGMKYIVITAKHHEGFAMFHTKVDDYSIYSATPYHKDPLKALAAACKKEHMRLGFYYSQSQDWHHPGGRAIGGHWDPAQDGSYDAYLKNVAIPQIKELFTNYGKVSVIWWDTPVDMTPARAAELVALLKMQPGIISNNRMGGDFAGDYDTPEQTIPPNGLGRDWETCMTINDTWGYKRGDHNFKSATTLVRNLIDIASKGGNYLLNVGPTGLGTIPAGEVKRLHQIGAWMKVNGTAIYGTSASPFKKQLPWGRCTQKHGLLYLSVFNWPSNGKLFVPIINKNVSAHLLIDKRKSLPVSYDAYGATITLPASEPDPIATVVVLNPGGAVEVAPTPPLQQAADGTVTLSAPDADIIGSNAQLEGGAVEDIGYWTNQSDYVKWNVNINNPGSFKVELTYSSEPDMSGSSYTISVGDQSVSGTIEPTQSWGDYKTVEVGTLSVSTTGKVTVMVKATSMPHGAVMNLQKVELIPVSSN